jgi:hypothetical protein
VSSAATWQRTWTLIVSSAATWQRTWTLIVSSATAWQWTGALAQNGMVNRCSVDLPNNGE